jgi:hypothetical protein
MPYTLQNSTFLDAFAANLYTDTQYQQVVNGNIAPLLDLFQYGTHAATLSPATGQVTVGLVLDHATEPTSLLSGNWAQRQTGLAAFSTPEALWAKYGADATLYSATSSQVAGVVGGTALTQAASQGYTSSAADRTIWVTLDAGQFKALFGQDLQLINTLTVSKTQGVIPTSYAAWTGNLQLNDAIAPGVIKGVWVDAMVAINNPAVLASTPVSLPVGPLGIGNGTAQGVGDIAGVPPVAATPAALAAQYHFPLPAGVATGPIALVESDGFGPPGALFAAYNVYRQQVGLPAVTQSQFQIIGNNGNNAIPSNELTLDISVVAGAAPNSSQLLYSFNNTPFGAYQHAFFDSTNQPAVLSSSWGITGQRTPDSPFAWAFRQLMVDGALANVSVHRASGDWGSNGSIGNGVSNIPSDHSSGYDLIVGGTSLVSLSSALSDPTLQTLLQAALHDDPAVVFPLVAAGLRELPSHLAAAAPGPAGAAATFTKLFETVWQSMVVTPGDTASEVRASFGAHDTGTGGISSTPSSLPSYQQAFGLGSLTGGRRGVPDVAALAGGDTQYTVLDFNYVNGTTAMPLTGDGGTSAASPLWASLTAQFNAIFHDQGLPDLGFYNDLIYIAAAIAPGSFNDIQLGNNVSSFYAVPGHTGVFDPMLELDVVPTGLGYSAGAGYDLVSGLGSPNGLLLARALTAIAHQQMSFSTSPALLDGDGHGGWKSGAKQDLLLQTTTSDGATVGVDIASHTTSFGSATTDHFAWTSRLAQQSLQTDFDPALARLFDKQAQGTVTSSLVGAGDSVGVHMDGSTGQARQAALTNPFGFADFFSGSDTLHISRAVAVAETVGGANNELAVVRLRQVGENNLQVTFYKVDDMAGTIDGHAPGEAAYAAAAQARAYHTTSGATGITGAGYGQASQALLQHVNAGDLIAMRLDNLTTGAFFWAFANANETVGGQKVGHLWNYGLNTWGWEDTFGGGDHDFNDLIVQLDFTSAHGHGWLA